MPEIANIFTDDTYDAIILSDVLEHLVHPDKLLKALSPKLTRGGVLCISLPNVRFWPEFVRPLLTGAWDYAPHGVLDGRISAGSLIRRLCASPRRLALSRLHLTEDALRGRPEGSPRNLLEALAADAGADAANSFYDESDVRQYAITLKRRDEPPPPRPYDPAILEARLAEVDRRADGPAGTGASRDPEMCG